MNIGGLLLGLLDIALVVAILLFIGVIIVWIADSVAKVSIPENVKKGYLIIVAIVAIIMVVSLLLGVPSLSISRRFV